MSFINFYQLKKQQFQIVDHAAELAYRFILAFVPFVMLLFLTVNTLSRYIPGDFIVGLKRSMPGVFDSMIDVAQNNFVISPGFILANFFLIVFILRIYVVAVRTFMTVINTMRNTEEHRSFVILWLAAFKLSLSILLLIVLLFFSTRMMELFINFLFSYFSIQPLAAIFSYILRYSGVIVGFFVVNFLYRRAPCSGYTFRQAIPGSLFVVLLWLILPPLLDLFGKTLDHIAGSTTAVLISLFGFLLHVYLACILLLFGCVVNEYVLYKRSKNETDK